MIVVLTRNQFVSQRCRISKNYLELTPDFRFKRTLREDAQHKNVRPTTTEFLAVDLTS